MGKYIAENERIGFVPYTHDDDEDMLVCWQDDKTQKGYNYVFQGTLEDLKKIDISGFPFWIVVIDKGSGAKIGTLRLSRGDKQDLAIWIYPGYRGKGYGKASFKLATEYIFRELNLQKIYAGCYEDNHASLRMLEQAGYIRNPAGDQQEVNCFTGEPITQMQLIKEMDSMMLDKEGILELLGEYGICTCEEFQYVDSSHGEKDIRRNYIIDKKYVLRLNSAHVMNDERIADLNRLIQRYRDFGMRVPSFIPKRKGSYILQKNGYICYLSEYLDFPTAETILDTCRKELIQQRVVMVAKFAQKYKGVDLIGTKSMFSIFDLSPYDTLLGGIDEKQDNCNNLIQDLKALGETALAEEVFNVNEAARRELRSVYGALPKCVFQGDENFSNVCVDDKSAIIGLFDFNMAGIEVNANYLANIAFQGNYFYTDEIFDACSASEIFDKVWNSYRENTILIKQHYQFTEQEFYAYKLYSKIVILFGYWNQWAYSEYAKNEKYRVKALELLRLVLGA